MSNKEIKRLGKVHKRVMGAMVLASLSIIFLPILFERLPQAVYLTPIPEMPPGFTSAKPISPADFTSLVPAAVPVPATAMPSGAWVMQITPLAEREQAVRLLQKLRQQHYPAYVRQLAKNRYRVYIGPETDKAKVEQWVITLQGQKINGQLADYNP